MTMKKNAKSSYLKFNFLVSAIVSPEIFFIGNCECIGLRTVDVNANTKNLHVYSMNFVKYFHSSQDFALLLHWLLVTFASSPLAFSFNYDWPKSDTGSPMEFNQSRSIVLKLGYVRYLTYQRLKGASLALYQSTPNCPVMHMGGNLLTVQSMEMMSYFFFFWPLFSAI